MTQTENESDQKDEEEEGMLATAGFYTHKKNNNTKTKENSNNNSLSVNAWNHITTNSSENLLQHGEEAAIIDTTNSSILRVSSPEASANNIEKFWSQKHKENKVKTQTSGAKGVLSAEQQQPNKISNNKNVCQKIRLIFNTISHKNYDKKMEELKKCVFPYMNAEHNQPPLDLNYL